MKYLPILLGGSVALASPLLENRKATTATSAGAQNTACADAAAAQSSQLNDPNYTAAESIISAELAVNCLSSIPINADDATALVQSYKVFVEVESDLEYLKNPPEGYCNPSFDWMGWLDTIQSKINSSAYANEFEFQTDLAYGLSQTYDGHVHWALDILQGPFGFLLDPSVWYGVASVSSDGVSLPEVYFVQDLVNIQPSNDTSVQTPQTGYTPSPIVTINGMPAGEALAVLGLQISSQDPDARYNTMIFSLGKYGQVSGALGTVIYPPTSGPFYYEFELANKTAIQVPILAAVNANLTGITDGEAAYEAFAPYAAEWQSDFASASSAATSYAAATSSAAATSYAAASSTYAAASSTALSTPTNIPYFPDPVAVDPYQVVAGYYLNDTANDDVAVLQVTGFEPSNPNADPSWGDAVTKIVQDFLDGALSDGKKKLIIDLQGNGGGLIDFGTSLFVQISANIKPNSSANMRRSVGMDVVIESASSAVFNGTDNNRTAEDYVAYNDSPWDFEYDDTPQFYPFNNTAELLSGIQYGGTNFTAFFQTNYSDPNLANPDFEGFTIVQPDSSAKPLFAAEDIIILTDGYCASTCTVFSEYMKNQFGVDFILVTGRPQTGPGQAIGGIKGSQVFEFSQVASMMGIFVNATAEESAQADGTEWEDWGTSNLSQLPFYRTAPAVNQGILGGASAAAGGFNGRNHFRIGDSTHTPLQYVYEAADCKIFFTPEMMYDANFLWDRVSEIAFQNRTAGSNYTSQYCVSGSTGNPTSRSGGWQPGTLGPQGQGKIEASSSIFKSALWANESSSDADWSKVNDAKSFGSECTSYSGSNWPVAVLCRAYNAMSSS